LPAGLYCRPQTGAKTPSEDACYVHLSAEEPEQTGFQWIKKHLKIKSFWCTTENAVRLQIYSALIAYCLVAVIGTDLKINRSTYEMLQILGISLLDKTPVAELLKIIDYKDFKEQFSNQLSLNLF